MKQIIISEHIDKLKEARDEFFLLEHPVFAQMLLIIGTKIKGNPYPISPNTFYEYIERDDEAGEIFRSMYNHLVMRFEQRLWTDRPFAEVSFKYLKCFNKLGFNYSENKYEIDKKYEFEKDNILKIEVVTRDNANS